MYRLHVFTPPQAIMRWEYRWLCYGNEVLHDDVIKWKHFRRYWLFVRGIHRSPVNSPHKGQWRGDLMFSLICTWINGWINNREADDLGRHRSHYDVTVMFVWRLTDASSFMKLFRCVWYTAGFREIQCGAVITRSFFFSKSPQWTPHSSL